MRNARTKHEKGCTFVEFPFEKTSPYTESGPSSSEPPPYRPFPCTHDDTLLCLMCRCRLCRSAAIEKLHNTRLMAFRVINGRVVVSMLRTPFSLPSITFRGNILLDWEWGVTHISLDLGFPSVLAQSLNSRIKLRHWMFNYRHTHWHNVTPTTKILWQLLLLHLLRLLQFV